jgi:hypothetical protein
MRPRAYAEGPLLERELQDYLFDHPELLVPDEVILEKSREFWIQGKRIDLLFRTERTRYIVELKAVPLTREHLGQVVEYYGLMREQRRNGEFKMILVSPSIAAFQKPFLEELGIRCIEMPSIPGEPGETDRLRGQAVAQGKRQRVYEELEKEFPLAQGLRYDDLVTGVSRRSLSISHRMLQDTLPDIRTAFTPYEALPIRMARADSPDRILSSVLADIGANADFVSGGAWWAYAFGESDQMPKNDIPNISAMAMPWGFDLAVNAELLTSQAVFLKRITAQPGLFDDLLSGHGKLQFQALLKLEHQPRFYFWLPIRLMEPSTFTGNALLGEIAAFGEGYNDTKQRWIAKIVQSHPEISQAQLEHMRGRNMRPNLALRLVRPFRRTDGFWNLPYKQQVAAFLEECCKLRPFIDFLR